MKIYRLIALLIAFVACSTPDQNNTTKLIIEKADTTLVNEKYEVKIYFDKKNCRIIEAYWSCLHDETVESLADCHKKLMVTHDTITIALTPRKRGTLIFQPITLLYINAGGEKMIMDTTFTYVVMPKH